ncbi:peptidylprolyl isomerase [Gymnodinialimonas ceratoperidinii]|uniref:Peptidylprolyl isomerase n=1 Tax=Gymnodinialimonas ceratoperidinii TaxID=2856823 RepID=A0A8F6YA99_9RHOB|nr:peptidylprolyl isomerase [Gymnodinialimonas ceratoperidinii]QXT38766.1 peptidylprolyl isomerase [Gymnodinialimonas ceratoperidinii]
MNGILMAALRMRRATGLGAALVAALCLGGAVSTPAQAQNPFSVAVEVNDSVVTNFEISQRMRFLEVLNAQGDLRQQAIEALVNERLQLDAALAVGAEASPEAIETGLEEFAARANLGAEQFLRQMAQQGIAPETVRDFVANGITWRNVVNARFRPIVEIDDEDVERALELGTVLGGGIEISLAEIIIPVTPDNQANLQSELGRLGRDLNGNVERFSQAAQRFSAAPTREAGGVTGWRPLNELPEGLREMFMGMGYGQVTQPVPLGGGQAYALFQFRGQREVTSPRLPITAIDYVTIALPGGRTPEALAEAARLNNAVDVCNDFNGVIPGGFERQSVPPAQVPEDIALAIRTLDNHEMSTAVTRNNGTVLLAVMLCDRVSAEPEAGIDAIRGGLFGQQLQRLAANYLEELRAEARINYVN